MERLSTEYPSPPYKYEWHCFISYTTREEEVRFLKPFLDEFIGILQDHGVKVCPVYYDGWYLRGDYYSEQELASQLSYGIRGSAFTLAFLSPGYMSSEWCRFEWLTTEEVHSGRGYPADEYSILPLCWKQPIGRHWEPLDSPTRQDLSLLSRRYLDISRAFPGEWGRDWPPVEVIRGVLCDAVSSTVLFLGKWYPSSRWPSYEEIELRIQRRLDEIVKPGHLWWW